MRLYAFVQRLTSQLSMIVAPNHLGIAKSLLRNLSDLCKRQNVSALLFNSTDMSRELVDKAKDHQAKVVRDSSTDWSVYRIEFK